MGIGRPGILGARARSAFKGIAVTVIDFTAFIGRLATASGETILPFFRTSLLIDDKSANHDFDPVTEADRAAEAVMRRPIKAQFSPPRTARRGIRQDGPLGGNGPAPPPPSNRER